MNRTKHDHNRKAIALAIVLFACLCGGAAVVADSTTAPLAWPSATKEARPWSYWWWLGSAVDEKNLTKELTRYRDAGWGGVHIIPIYGAKGWEEKFIEYLSPKWMEMLKHTVTEAQRLGLGVDMTTGTGWCFGGPNVSERDACAQAVTKTFEVAAGRRLKETFDREAVQALVAFSPDGKCVELTDKIGADGAVDWTAPAPAQGISLLLAPVSPEERELRKRREETEAKLDKIIIPKIEFKNASVVDVVNFLSDGEHWLGGKKTAGRGINTVLGGWIGTPTGPPLHITLSLRNVTFREALRRVCDLAGLKFQVEPRAVLIVPKDWVAITDPVTTVFRMQSGPVTANYRIQPPALAKALSASHADTSSEGLKKFFVEAGVPFPKGTSVTCVKGHLLFVTNWPENLDALEKLLAKLNLLSPSHHLVTAIRRELARGTGKALLKKRGLRKEIGEIEAKLEDIIIPKIRLRNVSLADAVKFLVGQSREVDAKRGGAGVRIELDESLLPVLKDSLPLTLDLINVPLRDAVRYVCDLTGAQFAVRPGMVVILPANWQPRKGASRLVTRSYQWKRNLLEPHLGASAGNVSGEQIKELLADAGAEFSTGASLAYDKRSETVTITNSPEALDVVEQILSLLEADAATAGRPWRVYAVSQKPTSKVKRAAPGGEGWMLNPIYADAIRHWLMRFTEAFASYDGPKPRAHYHDSFEYGVNWSPDLFAQFEKRRGYRLQTELPALFGRENNDHVARVKCDYRETMSDMMIEDSMPLWFNWCRERGFLTRNQAHGSPGNLLDLYALADIPETEMFHTDRRPLVAKFASSAAHIAGKKLVASETGTWLKEHFTETLADVQGLLDDLFVSGINHVVFHGTCYSPDEAGWPGWLFYASTEMNPRNSIWRDVPALAAYIARCQSVLQAGEPDNDILLYWPVYDCWHDARGMQMPFSVHGASWFLGKPIGKLAQQLWEHGFTFDYVSDHQLAGLKTGAGRVIVVPACEHMPVPTLEKLLALARGGATVIIEEHLPTDVPGLGDLERRQAEFKRLLERAKGRVQAGDVEKLLAKAGVAREPITDHAGLLFIRRAMEGGRYYFVANRGERPLDGWVTLAIAAKSVAIMDPMTGRAGVGTLRQSNAGIQTYLQLQPGESVVLRTFAKRNLDGPAWTCWQTTGQPVEITGNWQVKFIQGGPALPPPFQTARLASWTELGGEEAQRFAGAALYTLTFDAPAQTSERWFLDLGKVCQSARVRLNGRDLGMLITLPFRVAVDKLKPKGNVLEVEVTNVAANRIRDLDRRGVKWKNFHDINFVNINYRPFDASTWPLTDSGLLGPVLLRPLAKIGAK